MTDWKAGDKAYCVNNEGAELNLRTGTIYLIDRVLATNDGVVLSVVGVRLDHNGLNMERFFKSNRFKKIIPRSERRNS